MNPKKLTPAPLQQMINGFWISKVLSVATELEIFTKIDSGLTTIDTIAKSINAHLRPTEMLLNACVALELLQKKDKHYVNSPLAETFLVKGKECYFGDSITWHGNQLYDTWGNLKESILDNKPQVKDTTRLFLEKPEIARAMTNAMHNNAIGPARALAQKFDFSHFSKLLDIGGGSGAYSIIIAKSFSNIEAVVQDLKPVCDIAKKFVKNSGVENRVQTLSGDFFKIELPKADIVLLCQLLHSYNEKGCCVILQKAYDCLLSKGKIIIVDFFLNEDKTGPLFSTLFSLNMLLRSRRGMAYSEVEVCSLLDKTGFKHIENIDLAGPVKAIHAEKT